MVWFWAAELLVLQTADGLSLLPRPAPLTLIKGTPQHMMAVQGRVSSHLSRHHNVNNNIITPVIKLKVIWCLHGMVGGIFGKAEKARTVRNQALGHPGTQHQLQKMALMPNTLQPAPFHLCCPQSHWEPSHCSEGVLSKTLCYTDSVCLHPTWTSQDMHNRQICSERKAKELRDLKAEGNGQLDLF